MENFNFIRSGSLILLILFVWGVFDSCVAKENLAINVKLILESPHKYHKQEVVVSGYLRRMGSNQFELLSNEVDAKYQLFQGDRALFLIMNKVYVQKSLEFQGGNVIVTATFSFSQTDPSSGILYDVKSIEKFNGY